MVRAHFVAPILLTLCFASSCAADPAYLNDANQYDGAHYYFATVSKGQGRSVERLVPKSKVVTRHNATRRKRTYVIEDAAVATEVRRFGFERLGKAVLKVKLRRVSDINGRGVDEDGQVRRQDGFEREYKSSTMYTAFALLQALADDPWEAARKEAPKPWETVAEENQVDSLEVGYVIEVDAELVTGNPFEPQSRVTLFKLSNRSTYRRAKDSGSP